MRKTELLIPASSLEVLKIAVMFGADADVYSEHYTSFCEYAKTVRCN